MTNILKCTVKKSISVALKLLKFEIIAGLIVFFLGAIGYLCWLFRDFITSLIEIYYSWSQSVINTIVEIITSVHWCIWLIIVVTLCVIGYSFLRCLKKQQPAKFESFIAKLFAIACCCLGGVLGWAVFSIVVVTMPQLTSTPPILWFGYNVFIIIGGFIVGWLTCCIFEVVVGW